MKTETQTEPDGVRNLKSRCFAVIRLLASLAVLMAAPSFAQVSAAPPIAAAAPLLAASSPAAFAQISANGPQLFSAATMEDSSSVAETSDLPEDPSAGLGADLGAGLGAGLGADRSSQTGSPPEGATTAGPVVPFYIKYIYPGHVALQHLTGRDKFLLALHDRSEPLDVVSMLIAAGYEQLTNGAPNYGVDRGAYGERLGAAAIRQTSQVFFSDAVLASVLHEDPRFYIEGDQYGLMHRTLYAITRPLVTRTDGGRTTVNGSFLLGYAAAAALTNAYYPPFNRNFDSTAKIYGGSLGGAALGFLVYEFSEDALEVLHIKKRP